MEWNKFSDLMPMLDPDYGTLSVNVLVRTSIEETFATVFFINYASDKIQGFNLDCRLEDDKLQFSGWLASNPHAVWTYFTERYTDGELTEFNGVKIDQ